MLRALVLAALVWGLAAGPADAAPAPCAATQLAVSLGRGGVATGHAVHVVVLRNRSSRPCALSGYLPVRLQNRAGRPLRTLVLRATGGFWPYVPVKRVTLRPRRSASFLLGIDLVGPRGGGCARVPGLGVRVAGRWLVARFGARPCGGRVYESPVRLGVSLR